MGTSWAVHPCDHMTHCCCPALQESILILITSMKKDQNSTKSGNWYFQIVVLEKTLEHPLDCKEIKLVNPKGNQPWIFIGRTDVEAPILWPLDDLMLRTISLEKTLMAGKYWGQDENWVTENEMVAWHHWLKGHEFEQTLGDSDGQGSLAHCNPWGCKESDMTYRLNNNK